MRTYLVSIIYSGILSVVGMKPLSERDENHAEPHKPPCKCDVGRNEATL